MWIIIFFLCFENNTININKTTYLYFFFCTFRPRPQIFHSFSSVFNETESKVKPKKDDDTQKHLWQHFSQYFIKLFNYKYLYCEAEYAVILVF